MALPKCPYPACGKELTTFYHLNNHINSHHLGIKSFRCLHCSRNFAYKPSLRRHLHAQHRLVQVSYIPAPIPTLCSLLKHSSDPGLRPYERLYGRKMKGERAAFVILPEIKTEDRQGELPWLWGK